MAQLQINELDTDYKAIIIAAEMIESGQADAEQVIILPKGAAKRAFAKEVEEVESFHSESKRKDCHIIHINKEGLYDMLPEGLFHKTPAGSVGLSEEQMILDIKERRQEEKEARQFFMPVEAELNHLRVLIELYENRLDKKTTHNDLINIFTHGWPDLHLFNMEQSILFMHLLPVIHEERNNYTFIAQVLEIILKTKVNIHFKKEKKKSNGQVEGLTLRLGQAALGINMIMGASFDPEDEEMHINLGPMGAQQLLNYLPGTPNHKIIHTILSYLVSIDTEIKINLLENTETKQAILGQELGNACLGYTTSLG